MFKKIFIVSCSILVLVVGLFFGIKVYGKYSLGYTKVYVASHNIGQRTLISEQDLTLVEIPDAYLDDVYIDNSDIIGKYVKLGYSIPKGSLIYKGFIESDIKDLAHSLLKQGEVNYDLYTNDIKINTANLSKNMYIDIYLTIKKDDKPISDLLLANARITGLYDNNSKTIDDYDEDSRVYIVTIAINKEYVNVLNNALVLGTINCVVNANTYDTNLKCELNTNSKLFEYMQ